MKLVMKNNTNEVLTVYAGSLVKRWGELGD